MENPAQVPEKGIWLSVFFVPYFPKSVTRASNIEFTFKDT